MKKLLFIFLLVLIGCMGPLRQYYPSSNLNTVNVGDTKVQMLSRFSSGEHGRLIPLTIRATKVTNGKLLEVGEIWLRRSDTCNSCGSDIYWFLFVNGELKQWGQPQDWQNVTERYEIHYNPPAGVKY